MNGYTIGSSGNLRAILQDKTLTGYAISISRPRSATLSDRRGYIIGISGNRRAILTDLTLVGYGLTVSGNRRCMLNDLTLVGHCISGAI